MPSYACGRCGYQTDRLSNLKIHLQCDKECPPVLLPTARSVLLDALPCRQKGLSIPKCEGCHKVLADRHSLCRHRQTCDVLNSITKKCQLLERQLLESQQKVKDLEQQRGTASTSIHNDNSTTINNTNNIDNSTTINININSFGNEDLSYLTPEFLTSCVKNGADGLVRFIDKVHFDADHPENKNLRHLSKKQQLLVKYIGDGRWEKCDKNFTLDHLIDKNKSRLQKFMVKNEALLRNPDNTELDNMQLIQRYHGNYVDLKLGQQQFYSLRRQVYALIQGSDDGNADVTISIADE